MDERGSTEARRNYARAPRFLLAPGIPSPVDVYLVTASGIVKVVRAGAAPDVLTRAPTAEALVARADASTLRAILPERLRVALAQSGPIAAYQIAVDALDDVYRCGATLDASDLATLEATADMFAAVAEAAPAAFATLLGIVGARSAPHDDALASLVFALGTGVRLDIVGSALASLGRAALLHDIGKIGMPASFMSATSLNSLQRSILESHVGDALTLIERLRGSRPDYQRAIGEHHERLDGSGYPRGYKASMLSSAGRIVAVVDVFVALTAERPHRPRRDPFPALLEMRDDMRTQLDGAVVRELIGFIAAARG